MKILVQFFPGSKLEVVDVEPGFKMVPLYNGIGRRRKDSVWYIDYSHLDSGAKKFLADKAELINKKLDEIQKLEKEISRLQRALKENYCRSN